MSKPFDSKKQRLPEAVKHAEIDAATEEVTLWLEVEVIQKFKASGDGWQTRINDALKSWV